MIFLLWIPGHQKYPLIKYLVFLHKIILSTYLPPDIWELFFPFWFHWCSQLGHSTYQGPSLRTHQNYKSHNYPLSMRTYLHLGGESVMVCKEGGTIFTFWCHVAGDCFIVTWLMMSLPVLVMLLPVHESQILYKPSEFVYWLRAVLTWHLKASHLALHR